MLQYVFVNAWNDQYAALGFAWTNDHASGCLLVEGHHLPPHTEPPLIGTIEVLTKDIKQAGDKIKGKGETKEDWSAKIGVGDQFQIGGTFKVMMTKFAAPKYQGTGTKSKFIFGVLEFEFLGPPPSADVPAASICKVVEDCIIPKISDQVKLDNMIKERYLSGDVTTWDNTTARQALLDLAPRGSLTGQRLLTIKPTLVTGGMNYSETNQVYAAAHAAGSLTDADYVEWIVAVRNHQNHHADGRLEEAEYKHANLH